MALKPSHHSEKVSLYHQWQPLHRIWRRYRWHFPQKRTAAKGIFSLELMMASSWSPDLTVQKACYHWQGHPVPGLACLLTPSQHFFSLCPAMLHQTLQALATPAPSGVNTFQFLSVLVTLGSKESLPQQRRCSAHSTSCHSLTLALLSGLRPFG